MALYDIIFPMNIGPLTYSGPGGLVPGTLVEAEVGKTLQKGIILGQCLTPPVRAAGGRAAFKIKEIAGTLGDGPLLNPALLGLVPWMSDYYFAKQGVVLKETIPSELYGLAHCIPPRAPERKSPGHKSKQALPPESRNSLHPQKELCEPVLSQMGTGQYKGFLLHAASTEEELAVLCELVESGENIIVICPEISVVKHTARVLSEAAGEKRVTALHSGMTKAKRREALGRVLSNEADIVVGSRMALFVPMPGVSLISVLQEDSRYYKREEGLMFNTRDVAVMRGYLEGAAVLLSSICPSVESHYNGLAGKYTLIKSSEAAARPKIRVVNMRTCKKISPNISKELYEKAASAVKKGNRAALFVNRKGYSMLQCADCGKLKKCSACATPMVYYKGEKTLKCHLCGQAEAAPETCANCGGTDLKTPGAGLEKVDQEIKEAWDKKAPEGQTNIEDLVQVVSASKGSKKKTDAPAPEASIVLGTKLLTRGGGATSGEKFAMAGVVNADAYVHAPDFRSAERAFQDMVYLADKVDPGGVLIVQSRAPGSRLFQLLKAYDFKGLYEDELRAREELQYPPFSRAALVTFSPSALAEIKKRLAKLQDKGKTPCNVLGPAQGTDAKGKKTWKVLLMAPSREALREALATVCPERSAAPRKKGSATITVKLDIDPVTI